MSLLDRYLLRQFIWIFTICFCSLIGLYFVVDVFGNLEEFLAYSKKSGLGLGNILISYYGYQSLWFFDRTSSILTLIAAMFTLANLQRFNEFTALMAAGVSKLRIVRPLIMASIVIALLASANREFIIPKHRDKLSRNPQSLASQSTRQLNLVFDSTSGIGYSGRGLDFDRKMILEPTVTLPRSLKDYTKHLQAATAVFEAATPEHPSGYRLQGIPETCEVLTKPNYKPNEQQTLIFTPVETRWLAAKECFIASDLTFDMLAFPDNWKLFSSTSELIASIYQRGSDVGNSVLTTVHSRFVQPLLDCLLLLLGVPLLLRGANRNIFIAIGLSMGVVIAFMCVVMAGQSLSANYLINPLLGAWLPLLLFVPLAAYVGEPLWE